MHGTHWRVAGTTLLLLAGNANSSEVVINELLGSTTGRDSEFVELYNNSTVAVDISGWFIELWDSDSGSHFGNPDAASPYFVPEGTILEPNQFFLFANELTEMTYGVTADVLLPANAIENSSYTVVLKDVSNQIINSIFVTDGGPSDLANIAGDLITPDLSFGPDGSFLPAGFFRIPDGGNELGLLEFSPQPSPSATPTSSFSLPPLEPTPLLIGEIQGETHTSPYLAELVKTSGVVTAVDSHGFYVQDPEGDGNIATSDALFVFTGRSPNVAVGDLIELTGEVSEFFPGGQSTRNLSQTQMAFPDIEVIGSHVLPEPVVLGLGGRVAPSESIDDDAFASFDVEMDGIDYFESLEAMRVLLPNALASAPTNRFSELFTVADLGANASGLSERQTLNISPNDFNPEKIQIDADSGILPGFEFPFVNTGAVLTDVVGVISYDFGNFQIHPTQAFDVIPSSIEQETSLLQATNNRLTIASYNVLNLDPKVELIENVNNRRSREIDDDVGLGRFDAIAAHIVHNLNQPDIIALQEVQDNDGAEVTDVASADLTLQTLATAISNAGGAEYAFLDTPGIVPAYFENGSVVRPVGGQPGGNIRVAYLYNPSRVSLVGDAEPLTDPADQAVNPENPFYGSRISLAAKFEFNDEVVTVINNHFSSKGGSAPIMGVEQPFEARQEEVAVNGSLDERQAQATAVNAYVGSILSSDPQAKVVVLGDLNEFEFISPLSEILATQLNNMTETLPENERYSFIFQGNSQQLDHVLLSQSVSKNAEFDIVHVNSEFAETAERASDHDPLLVSLAISLPGDLNGNGRLDKRDLRIFARALGSKEGQRRYLAAADFNGNGRVDYRDFKRFMKLYKESLAISLQGDLNGNGKLDRRDLRMFSRALGAKFGQRRYLAAADFNNSGRVDYGEFKHFIKLYKKSRKRS